MPGKQCKEVVEVRRREQPRGLDGRYQTVAVEPRKRRLCVRLTQKEAAAIEAVADRRECTMTEALVQLAEEAVRAIG